MSVDTTKYPNHIIRCALAENELKRIRDEVAADLAPGREAALVLTKLDGDDVADPRAARWAWVEDMRMTANVDDKINHPAHYTSHPSGVECIAVTEHMNFCLGNAMKYIWRSGQKSPEPLDDLAKAKWYIEREIARLKKQT